MSFEPHNGFCSSRDQPVYFVHMHKIPVSPEVFRYICVILTLTCNHSILIYLLPARISTTTTMLPHQHHSWVVPTCIIYSIGFLIALVNLPAHFKGERRGERVTRWPPRPFREKPLLMPLWPVVLFLPALLWPVWLAVSIVRKEGGVASDEVVDGDESEAEAGGPRGTAVDYARGEEEGQGRRGLDIERGAGWSRWESCPRVGTAVWWNRWRS